MPMTDPLQYEPEAPAVPPVQAAQHKELALVASDAWRQAKRDARVRQAVLDAAMDSLPATTRLYGAPAALRAIMDGNAGEAPRWFIRAVRDQYILGESSYAR